MLERETPALYFITRQIGAVGQIFQQKQYSMKLSGELAGEFLWWVSYLEEKFFRSLEVPKDFF